MLNDDIRNHGSGNIGATNVGRVIGWKWGGLVLFLDALKGLWPTYAAMYWAKTELPESLHTHIPVATGISTILGHMYPIYLKLRGGKGVATALGVVLVLAPQAVGIAFVVFASIAGVFRIVGLASIFAALTFGVTQLWLMGPAASESNSISLTIFSIAIPLLIVWRHRSNIANLIKGQKTPAPNAAEKD